MYLYEITSTSWEFDDGKFTFWTAHYGSWANDKRIVFRVRSDRTPKVRAAEKGVKDYDRLLPSIDSEVRGWFDSHPGFDGQKS